MIRENKIIELILDLGRKIIPRSVFESAQPIYHALLAYTGAVRYGFPSKKMKLIGITGTKGKSTTVFMISKLLEDQGHRVAAIGSLGFKIRDRVWPNTLKMTMPGRWRLQKFLSQAYKAGCQFVILEVTSEGIKQKRHLGVDFDCAVFTNLHKEHLETHGSFENYLKAKQELFARAKSIHILNIDDPYYEKFANFPAKEKITFGKEAGDINKLKIEDLKLKILGDFNFHNAMAALAVAKAYGLNTEVAIGSLAEIQLIPGRMDVVHSDIGFDVVVDYAHTPDSLEAVYKNLKGILRQTQDNTQMGKLICVLGAAGGGRDKWKRPEFGKIAGEYCDAIVLTNEDPYDENPDNIITQIAEGIPAAKGYRRIIDRKEAIENAISEAQNGDIVVITGKGSEVTMAIKEGKKIPWSDKKIVLEVLS